MTRSVLSPQADTRDGRTRLERSGIAFATGDTALCLTELVLDLNPNLAPGALTVSLYCQSPTQPAAFVAIIGTVSHTNIPKSSTGPTEVPIATAIMLQANTQYWIELNSPGTPRATDARTRPPSEATIKDLRVGERHSARRPGQLQGRLDTVTPHHIAGWARDLDAPDRPVVLQILDNGAAIGTVTADRFRADLAQAGIGQGEHSFSFVIAGGLSPLIRHIIQIQRLDDGQDLPASPWIVEPTAASALDLPWRCCGQVDEVTRDRITGWALDRSASGEAVVLDILANDIPLGRVVADRYRTDLVQAGFGLGCHGFEFTIPEGLSPLTRQVITVRRERDGAELPGSPAILEVGGGRGAVLPDQRPAIDGMAGGATTEDPVMSFMLAQAERLGGQRADGARVLPKRLLQGGPQRRTGMRKAPDRRALVVDDRMPATSQDAGSVAILSHMRGLQRLGYTVSFAAAQKIAPTAALTDRLEAAGIAHFNAAAFESVEDIVCQHAGYFDVIYLNRAAVASRCLALARSCDPKARILYNVGDLQHLRLQRQAAIEDRPALLAASNRMRLAEFMAALSADAVITHSTDEAAILRHAAPRVPIHSVPWHLPVRAATTAFTARNDIAFIGHYSDAPNEDAACWLVETVMPLVWQLNPDIRCLLAGSEMTARIRGLARPGIVPLGPVASLHDAVFERVRLTVAPLRYGAGLTGKVLQSLAAGVPCVMSAVAAEGLNATPALQALIGRDAASLAALICHLHADPRANANLARAGLSFIRTNFTEDRVAAGLQAAIAGRGQGADPLAPIARRQLG